MSVLREVEIKFRLDSPDDMLSRLRSMGCSPGPPVTEVSILLDSDDGGLAETGRTLRLRRSGDRVLLTAKGPRRPSGPAKDRSESEVEVRSGVKEMLDLLELAGFRPVMSYSRKRSTCRLGRATVCIDSFDFGTYMEVEAESPEELRAACGRLGLDMDGGDDRSYPELMGLHRSGKDDR